MIVQDVDYVLLDSTRSYNLCDFRCNGSDSSVYLNAVNVGGLKPHPDFLSGSVTIPVDTFKRVNGYSNDYWGWGGEDDELLLRVKQFNLNWTRPVGKLGFYNAITTHHGHSPFSEDR